MLYADKNDLQRQLKLNLLKIEERELIYFTDNCYNIGTQAALLAGFSFSALMQASAIAGTMNKGIQGAWASITVLAMVFEIMALVKATQLAITGPGLALRGPEGSMTHAISVMRIEYRKIGQLFYAGLAFTLMSTAIYSLTIFEPEVTSAVVGLITICMCWLYSDLKHMSSGMQYESVTGETVRDAFVWFPSTVTKAGAVFSAQNGHDDPESSTRLSGSPARRARTAVKITGHRPLSLAWFDGKLGVSRLQARLQKRGLVRKTADAKGGAPSSPPAAAATQGNDVCRTPPKGSRLGLRSCSATPTGGG